MAFFRRTYLLNQLAISIAKLYTGAVRSRKLSDAAVLTKYRRQRNWSARLGLWQFRARGSKLAHSKTAPWSAIACYRHALAKLASPCATTV